MKFFKRLFCGFLAGISLFSCGCGMLSKDSSAERNVSIQCAPCTVKEIWAWNEEVFQEFYYIRMSTAYAMTKAVKCTVNGEEWDLPLQIRDDLPVGKYEIRFYTEAGFTMPIQRLEDGQVVKEEIPYEKDLTLSVSVSEEYGDIFDTEYRRNNGLWTDPSQEKWYQDFMAEINKK